MAEYRIEREVVIEAPVEVVWRTITEPDQIRRWFAERVELEVKPGGRGTLVFNEPGHDPTTAALVVEDVEAPSRFSFRWCHPEGEEPVRGNSVLVQFTLVAQGTARTRLAVRETGVDLLDWPDEDKDRFADDHRGGWATILGRLQGLCERAPADRRAR